MLFIDLSEPLSNLFLGRSQSPSPASCSSTHYWYMEGAEPLSEQPSQGHLNGAITIQATPIDPCASGGQDNAGSGGLKGKGGTRIKRGILTPFFLLGLPLLSMP